MKTHSKLRLLSLLGFLLLFAPFYDSCEDKKNGFIKTYDVYDVNGKLVQKTFLQNVYNIVVDELSFNGYDIASISIFGIQESTFDELKNDFIKSFQQKGWQNNLGFFISIVFNFIIITSFLILVLSFFKRNKLLNKLALINTILVALTFLYVISLESTFEYWHQIKYGYYTFIFVNILIYFYSKKAIESSTKLQ